MARTQQTLDVSGILPVVCHSLLGIDARFVTSGSPIGLPSHHSCNTIWSSFISSSKRLYGKEMEATTSTVGSVSIGHEWELRLERGVDVALTASLRFPRWPPIWHACLAVWDHCNANKESHTSGLRTQNDSGEVAEFLKLSISLTVKDFASLGTVPSRPSVTLSYLLPHQRV
jgi:hypothetical protein